MVKRWTMCADSSSTRQLSFSLGCTQSYRNIEKGSFRTLTVRPGGPGSNTKLDHTVIVPCCPSRVLHYDEESLRTHEGLEMDSGMM